MKSILKIQKDGVNTLKEEILSHSNNKLKKIYVITSNLKETGYDIIEECLIDLKARKFIAFGVDKKNTTRKILDSVLKYTKTVYIWDNNQEVEFNSNVFVFEYENEAYIYVISGDITDSALDTDLSMYTQIVCDLVKDKKEYEEYIDTLTKEIKQSFVKLTKEYIDELVEEKLIFTTKQYIHTVPSIAELLDKTEKESETVENKAIPLPKIDLSKEDMVSFDIDLGETFETHKEVEVQTNDKPVKQEVEMEAFGLNEIIEQTAEEEYIISDEAIDMEAMVMDNNVVRINKNEVVKEAKKQRKEQKDKQTSRKINLSKVSNIIMELSKKPTKGKDIDKIKIPNYIKDMVPNFFEIMEEAKYIKQIEGEYKEVKVKLEIIDVNTSEKHTDGAASLRQRVGQTYVEFESEKLAEIMYEEMDIARVIKLAKDSYHIEIIPQGIEEYSLWDKLCVNNFKGSNRQYGLM